MFSGGKGWRIWQIVHGSLTLTCQILAYKIINGILMVEIYPFAKLFFTKYFQFGNSPNINPAKHFRYTVFVLHIHMCRSIPFSITHSYKTPEEHRG